MAVYREVSRGPIMKTKKMRALSIEGLTSDALIQPHIPDKATNHTRILELRKEKSRDAARSRRGKENYEFYELAKMLPLPNAITSQLDKASIIRLTVSCLKLRDFSSHGDPPWNRDGPPPNKSVKGGPPRRRTQSAVAQEVFEAHQAAHILQSMDGFAFTLANDGRFLYISETVSIYLGLSQVEMTGSSMFDYIHHADQQEFAEELGMVHPSTTTPSPSSMTSEDTSTPLTSPRSLTPPLHDRVMVMNPSLASGDDRSFCVRMKSTLTKRGVHVKSSGYRVVHIMGHMRPQMVFSLTRKQAPPPLLGFVGLAIALPPPTVNEILIDNDMFVTRLGPDFKVLHCEPRISDLMDLTAEDILNKSLYEFCHAEDLTRLRTAHHDLLNKGQVLSSYFRLMNKHGGYIWLQLCATTICNNKNQDDQSHIVINYVLSGVEHSRCVMNLNQQSSSKMEGSPSDHSGSEETPDQDDIGDVSRDQTQRDMTSDSAGDITHSSHSSHGKTHSSNFNGKTHSLNYSGKHSSSHNADISHNEDAGNVELNKAPNILSNTDNLAADSMVTEGSLTRDDIEKHADDMSIEHSSNVIRSSRKKLKISSSDLIQTQEEIVNPSVNSRTTPELQLEIPMETSPDKFQGGISMSNQDIAPLGHIHKSPSPQDLSIRSNDTTSHHQVSSQADTPSNESWGKGTEAERGYSETTEGERYSEGPNSVRDLEAAMTRHLPTSSTHLVSSELQNAVLVSDYAALQKQKSTIQWIGSQQHLYDSAPLPASNLLRQLYANRESVIRSNPRPQYYTESSLLTPPGGENHLTLGQLSSKSQANLTTPITVSNMADSGYNITPPSSVSPSEKFLYSEPFPGDSSQFRAYSESVSHGVPIKPHAYPLPAHNHSYDRCGSQYPSVPGYYAGFPPYTPGHYPGHQ
ncbi:unnamed protein product [Owenia fusiformis]|uniref:Uncharacterized protein n=1 Tax=Owenia fusiformis TaxID=6347 RepID=A0A8J1U2K8_OWEFU|nr:unnamed protein product [Owenia fusiformis]